MGARRDSRERMVRSATVLLRDHGLAGTSFDRVVTHAGASRGSIGHHFPGGKADLIVDAVTSAGAEIAALLEEAADQADAAAVLNAVCDYFSQWLTRTNFAAGCPIAAVAQEGFAEPRFRVAAAEAIESWLTILTRALRAAGHSPSDSGELAQICVSSVEGAILLARVNRSLAPLEAIRHQLGRLLAVPASG